MFEGKKAKTNQKVKKQKNNQNMMKEEESEYETEGILCRVFDGRCFYCYCVECMNW